MTTDGPDHNANRTGNPQRKTALQLALVVVVMASLSFAAVPFYDWFCRVTGFAGTTMVAESAPDTILDRTVTVRFDGSLMVGMPWEFRPVQRKMTVRIGEQVLAFYEAYNPSDRPVAGQASYNISPDSAGGYFSKIECFCFTEQVLQPGERLQMPVSFFVDPSIIDDPEAAGVHTITLSYTFSEIPLPDEQAGLAPTVDAAVKLN